MERSGSCLSVEPNLHAGSTCSHRSRARLEASSGYDASELAGVYTGNEARVDLIVEQLRRRVADLRKVRAIAFCVSVEHAVFMAAALSRRGVPALDVHGHTAYPADMADALDSCASRFSRTAWRRWQRGIATW